MLEGIDSPTDELRAQVQPFAEDLVNFISEQTQIVGFWSDLVSRDELRKQIWLKLETSCLLPENKLDSLADQLTQFAERHTSNQGR